MFNILDQAVQEEINEFLDEVSLILDIDVPVIDIDDAYLDKLNSQMRSEFSLETNASRIVIRSVYNDKVFFLFSIAHELRHHYQFLNFGPEYMKEKSLKEVSIDEYNLQQPEVDASSFAMFVMRKLYDIQISLNDVSEKTNNIIKEYSFKFDEQLM